MPRDPQAEPEAPLPARVECYAGYRGEETPRRFQISGRWLEVEELLVRWLAPDHRYFEVRAGDGRHYLLRHDAASQLWELVPHRRERGESHPRPFPARPLAPGFARSAPVFPMTAPVDPASTGDSPRGSPLGILAPRMTGRRAARMLYRSSALLL
jgi:hypothetical protein